MISNDVAVKDTLLSATYMVILFTVFVQVAVLPCLVHEYFSLGHDYKGFGQFSEHPSGSEGGQLFHVHGI